MPEFPVGKERIEETHEALDPSGFVDCGFYPQRAEELQNFIRASFEKFVSVSNIPSSILDQFPSEIPLYCMPEEKFPGCIATLMSSINIGRISPGPDGTLIFPEVELPKILLQTSPTVLRSDASRTALRNALWSSYCHLIADFFATPMNISRNQAYAHGILNKLQSTDDVDPNTVQATTGLSFPDGYALSLIHI